MGMAKPAVKVQTSPKSRIRKQVRVDAIRLFSVFALDIEIVDTTDTTSAACYPVYQFNYNNAVCQCGSIYQGGFISPLDLHGVVNCFR